MYTAQVLYPWTGAGEAANDRQLQDTDPASTDGATQCAFGTDATVRWILAKPLASNSTSAAPAAGQGFGWHILKSDMNSPAEADDNRHITAGTWSVQGSLSASTPDILSASYGVRMFVHRRSSTGTLTQLGSAATSAFQAAPALGTIDWTLTYSGAEMLFATDETLHLEFWVQGRGGGATGLISQTVTFNLGTPSGGTLCQVSLPSPGIRTRFFRTLQAAVKMNAAAAFARVPFTALTAGAFTDQGSVGEGGSSGGSVSFTRVYQRTSRRRDGRT